MKKIYRILLLILILCVAYSFSISASTTVKINKKNFPDRLIRETVKEFDKNKDNYLSKKERNAVCYIKLDKNKLIHKYENSVNKRNSLLMLNCKGLEKFKNIESLELRTLTDGTENLGKGKIKNLKNIYGLKKLETLVICNASNIKKVDLSKYKNLKSIKLYYMTKLNKIDVSRNKELKEFSINASIKKIELGNNKKLRNLNILACKNLKNVNLSKNTELRELSVRGCTQLETLKLRKNHKIKVLNIGNTRLKKVTLNKKNKIKELYADSTNIESSVIESTNTVTLEVLVVYGANIKTIDLSKFENCREIHVSNDVIVEKAEKQETKVFTYPTREVIIKDGNKWLNNNKKYDLTKDVLPAIPYL